MTPFVAFERLFFAVFGQTTPDDINPLRSERPEWTENLFKLVFGVYLLVSVVVLINLLIAMMSDTYQRIQVIKTITFNLLIYVFFSFFFLILSSMVRWFKTKRKMDSAELNMSVNTCVQQQIKQKINHVIL